MTHRKFFIQLSILTFIVLILSILGEYLNLDAELITMTRVSVLFFTVFCLIIYFLAIKTISSSNKQDFNSVIRLSIGAKMMFVVLFILVYKKLLNPASKYVAVPFIGLYILYTIFETYFMIKISKSKKADQ